MYCQNYRLTQKHRFLDRRTEEHIFVFTRNARNDTEFCSACFCEGLRRLRETITLRTALVQIRVHSWLKKNTSRYAQIRGDFSVDSVDCFPLTSSDSDFQFRVKIIARRRRRTTQTLCETLRLCVRIKIYPFCPSVKIIAHRTHRNTQKLCFVCCSAKVCAVCVKQFHAARH